MWKKIFSAETYTSIFNVAFDSKKVVGVYPLPAHLYKVTLVSFKVAKKALKYTSGESGVLHKPSGHGHSWIGSMKPTMTDQFYLLGLYHKDSSAPLYAYVTRLYAFQAQK